MFPVRRVMVVEDDRDVRDAVEEVLQDHGLRTIAAANGALALALLRAAGAEPPGLILLDLMMPVMDGIELLAELRSDPELARIPVVVTSAGITVLDGVAHLPKPFDLEALVALVRHYCAS